MFMSLTMAVIAAVTYAGEDRDADSKVTRNVAIIIHEGVELLDFAGPGEVFEAASSRGTEQGRPWFSVYTVAPSEGTIVSQDFVTIVPQYTIENCPPPDILVVPGGATGVLTRDQRFMSWVKAVTADTEIAFSVCTGAFVYAQSGLLDGLEATTHWSGIDRLRKEAPRTTVHEKRRFIDNGGVVTTAGVSAGIDGALHVVARLLGRHNAEQTARYMEYNWQPDPVSAEAYEYLNPQLDEHRQARQHAGILREQKKLAEAVEAYGTLVARDPQDGASWYGLGAVLHALGRYDEAIPAHRRAAELGPSRINGYYNLACAYALTGKTDDALDALAKAVETGFRSKGWLERDTDLDSIRDDPRFIEIVARIEPW